MSELASIFLLAALGSDLLLVHLIGICPALSVSRKFETAAGLAASNVVVAPVAALASYSLIAVLPESGIALLLRLPIIVVACLVCVYLVASVGERLWPQVHDWLEPFVPLMTVNCTLLGVVLLVLVEPRGPLAAFIQALGLAVGYGFFLIVFSQIRERLTATPVPQAFRDAPISLLTMAIIAMALSGFGVGRVA